MFDFDLGKLLALFQYNPQSPVIFNSGFFLFLFLGFMIFYLPLQGKNKVRLLYVTLFSYFFYYKSSGIYFIFLLLTTVCDFLLANRIARSADRNRRKIFLGLSIAINLGLLSYFKYTNLFYELWCGLSGTSFDPLNIFLPVGISFFTFQSMSYTIDVYRKQIPALDSLLDYAFYVSFFPQLVAGPIVRAKEFLPQINCRLTVTKEMLGRGIFLITTGLFKKAVISDYISTNFVDRIFDSPSLYSGLENLFGIYGYALQIYCDFSGYSDMAIGLALLLGYRFNINFDSPYKSATITEFWRRWHISLSSWLRDYLYISLGGNRKGKFRTYLHLILTMLLGGLWHGASIRFLFWGAMHGIALAGHKLAMTLFPSIKAEGAQMKILPRIAGIFLTFHLVCFGWLFFRADTFQSATEMIRQIFTSFHAGIFLQLISGYPLVFSLIATGFLLHFTPRSLETACIARATKLSLFFQALILVAVILVVMQIKSADIHPFIYFQF